MKHENLLAYQDTECLTNFDDVSFARYCKEKLATCDSIVELIRGKCVDHTWHGRVCEIGSGNSKLLYRLELEGLLQQGVGIEVSHSRHAFSEKFKLHVGSTRVANRCGNILDAAPLCNLDLVVGVDIVFQLIAPLQPDADRDVLAWAYRSLRDGGWLLLDFRDFARDVLAVMSVLRKRRVHLWEEFPQYDPYRYLLADIVSESDECIRVKNTFLKRDTMEESCTTYSYKPYSPEDATTLLETAGFSGVDILRDWQNQSSRGTYETYVVLARKRAADDQ